MSDIHSSSIPIQFKHQNPHGKDNFGEMLASLSTGTKQGKSIGLSERLVLFRKLVESGKIDTIEYMLPLIFNLKGKPFTLADHFPFQPVFKTQMPNKFLLVSGRQVSKSTSMAAWCVAVANSIPHFSILCVTPLYEQVRRFSNNYIREFINESAVKSLWTGTNTENSVLQRSFKNFSKLYFTFAFTDCGRARGLSAEAICWDELADMDPDHIPIIKEVISHAKYGVERFAGTPKTEDNIMEGFWRRSSQAEWFIKCNACNFWNIPSKEHHILKMLGPIREDISNDQPAVVCAKCARPINPRNGRWCHRHPNRRGDFDGYHIPQIIMPIHYSSKKKWAELLGKQRGLGNTTKAMFFNEVLGESFDEATKLVTIRDLQLAATLPWVNRPDDPEEACQHAHEYPYRCLAVDWGGGGEKETSFTTLAVLGWHPTGRIDVLWGKRSLAPHDHIGEARECLRIFNKFDCMFLAHDYTGAGALRETFIHHAGVPIEKIIPIAYVRTASKNIMSLHPATRAHPRNYFQVDKARSLQLTCNCIKLGSIKFFQYDYINDDDAGLVHDFLALIENKVNTAHAGDMYTIIRNEFLKDDFAQAVNIGCCALWHATDLWPNISELVNIKISLEQLNAAEPDSSLAWLGDSGV